MKDLRQDWFMQQNYTKEELEKLWIWCQSSGARAYIVEEDGQWNAYHIDDIDHEIDLVTMDTEEMCEKWVDRLDFTLVPLTEIRKVKINKLTK